jgi:hypothetical protein
MRNIAASKGWKALVLLVVVVLAGLFFWVTLWVINFREEIIVARKSQDDTATRQQPYPRRTSPPHVDPPKAERLEPPAGGVTPAPRPSRPLPPIPSATPPKPAPPQSVTSTPAPPASPTLPGPAPTLSSPPEPSPAPLATPPSVPVPSPTRASRTLIWAEGKTDTEIRNDLRAKTDVVLIRPRDERLGLNDVPAGYYGFVANFAGPIPITGPSQWVERNQSPSAFEVHWRKEDGRRFLIGFVDDATAQKIRKLSDSTDIEVALNNRFSDDAPNGVAVRFPGIVRLRRPQGKVGGAVYELMVGLRLP